LRDVKPCIKLRILKRVVADKKNLDACCRDRLPFFSECATSVSRGTEHNHTEPSSGQGCLTYDQLAQVTATTGKKS
jgi:hypothetical protein